MDLDLYLSCHWMLILPMKKLIRKVKQFTQDYHPFHKNHSTIYLMYPSYLTILLNDFKEEIIKIILIDNVGVSEKHISNKNRRVKSKNLLLEIIEWNCSS